MTTGDDEVDGLTQGDRHIARRLVTLLRSMGNPPDLAAGAAVVAVGALALWEASAYRLGQLTRMGPGYFPVSLGVLMIGLGLAILLWERRRGEGAPAPRPAWRALLSVSAAIVVFALLIERAGLVPAVMATTVIAALAEPKLRVFATLALAAFLVAFCLAVFIGGLGMPIPLVGGP